MSTRVGPVEHFVHGCHTVAAHRRNVTTGHNGVIHPRMHCQLLLDSRRTLRKTSLSCSVPGIAWWRELTFANRVLPVPGGPYMRMFLYRPLFCLVFLVAMAISRTRSSKEGWQRQMQVNKMHWFVSKQPFLCLLTLSTTPSRASWGLLFRRLAVWIVSGGRKKWEN